MAEYRIDVMQDASPHAKVIHSEWFTARSTGGACQKAGRILDRNATAGDQYGDLWMRDPDGGTQAEYVDTISQEI